MKNMAAADNQMEYQRHRHAEMLEKRRQERAVKKKTTEEKALELLEKAILVDKQYVPDSPYWGFLIPPLVPIKQSSRENPKTKHTLSIHKRSLTFLYHTSFCIFLLPNLTTAFNNNGILKEKTQHILI